MKAALLSRSLLRWPKRALSVSTGFGPTLMLVMLLGAIGTRSSTASTSEFGPAGPGVKTNPADSSLAEKGPAAPPVNDPRLLYQTFREVLLRPEFQRNDGPDLKGRFESWLRHWLLVFGGKLDNLRDPYNVRSFVSLFALGFMLITLFGLIYIPSRWLYLYRLREPWPWRTSGRSHLFPEERAEQAATLDQAVEAGRWKQAWSLAWMFFLAQLESSNRVGKDRSKTNCEYLRELERNLSLPDPSILAELHGMVREADEIFYGQRPLTFSLWQETYRQLNAISLRLGVAGFPSLRPGKLDRKATGAEQKSA